jgi:chromosome transmission fidelity protein 8
MPSIPIRPSASAPTVQASPLPNLLQTPSGLALLEIQGTVNSTQKPLDSGALGLGKLSFPLYDSSKPQSDTAWQKRVHLYVGKHQRLTGEIKKLPMPVAVLRRVEADEGQALEVAEIVYYKLLFMQRPEPVGTSVEA